MNTARLKEFAPAARRSLLASVKGRAMIYGITSDKPDRALVKEEGDLVRINGILYPKGVQREWISLVEKVEKEGFEPVMEQAAYTWFNRLAALRYMEVHGYLDHKRRVLSHPAGGLRPEILEHAQSIEIPGLDRRKVLELLADGSKSEELYQYLLLQQCWALHTSLPLLFENLEPAIRLLIPDNLLAPNSIIRSFVEEIPEEDWRTTEILGWLYQFYVLEEKQRVDDYVAKRQPVAPEDIPAKTQLFTPNWIVQFLTQNSLGRLWMDVYPDSPLREKMPYFTPPAEQEPEVAAKLKEITPESLDPKTLTAIDPAAGSGHILLELYSLFFEMYREQGYPPQQIPRLILENNLHGLELDRRAAQIAGFSLLMRARADDPQLLNNPPQVKVLALRHSRDLDLSLLLSQKQAEEVFPSDRLFDGVQPRLAGTAKPIFSQPSDLRRLKELFEEADVLGSLIRVPKDLFDQLQAMATELTFVQAEANLLVKDQLILLQDLIRQARTLAGRYTACVANPPYLGGKVMAKELKDFAKNEYPSTKSDLFAMFMERGFDFAEYHGFNAMVTMQSWMFLSRYQSLRKKILEQKQISCMAHLGSRAFPEIPGDVVQVTVSILRNIDCVDHRGTFYRLLDEIGEQKAGLLKNIANRFDSISQSVLLSVPGCPIAYWASHEVLGAFSELPRIGDLASVSVGLFTCDNSRFLRFWWEIPWSDIGIGFIDRKTALTSGKRYFPYNKGGGYRKWYGLNLFVVQFQNDGIDIRLHRRSSGQSYTLPGEEHYFKEGVTWSGLTADWNSFRFSDYGFIFESNKGQMLFSEDDLYLLGLLNTEAYAELITILNPTVSLQSEEIKRLPVVEVDRDQVRKYVGTLVDLARRDWDASETSWDFSGSVTILSTDCQNLTDRAIAIAEADLQLFTKSENLIEEIVSRSLNLQTNVRSSASLTIKSRGSFIKSLISYTIGCMVGRYSLDEPGLIYADAGGEGFDPRQYSTFPADEDGILPLTDENYFGEEDTAERLAQWVKTVWSESPLEENIAFIAENLRPKAGESSMETIRRYLVEDFYSDHLQTYKKRPIYWLFSSGRKRAFQALVYLHRYHPGTLGRMRSQYVLPLIGKLQAQVDMADQAAADPSATASQKSQRSREAKKLKEQLAELLEFDTRLLHYANKAIALDLDDGVKVNYGKFSDPAIGDILAKVKDITGGKDD